MRYNSYVILDEKTALLDTADVKVSEQFLKNVKETLGGKQLDYLIIHHAEPDHSYLVSKVLDTYPTAKLVTAAMTLRFLNQFCGKDLSDRAMLVKEGDTLELGKHSLKFIAAPMVHWPEVMVSYDEYCHTLFSADAFGSFGAKEKSLKISDLKDLESWKEEARRYYSNIVGRFGTNVTALLKKASGLKIDKICPLHGLVFDKNIDFAVNTYSTWASMQAEKNGVLIVGGSMYGNTEEVVEALGHRLLEKNIEVSYMDASSTDISYMIADCFKYSTIIIASATYYGGIFPKVEYFLTALKKYNLVGRNIGFIENGTWAATCAKQMKEMLKDVPANFDLPTVTVKSAETESTSAQITALAEAIAKLF